MVAAAHSDNSSLMSLHSHIKELRTRLFVVAAAFIVFSSLAYVFRDTIIHVLLMPLDGQKLSYLNPGGGFSFIFKVSMWFGIAMSLPLMIFTLYKFVGPALPLNARKQAPIVLLVSTILLICGALFGYYYAIPGAIRFLLEFADEYVQAMLTADSYLNFVLAYTVGLGILFQIPLFMMIIHWVKPLGPKKLLSFERYVIVIAFIAAAIITPTPDVVNQMIIAAPIILMYQIGVIAVMISIWRQKRRMRNLRGVRTSMARSVTTIAAPIASSDTDGLLALFNDMEGGTQPRVSPAPRRRPVMSDIRRPQTKLPPQPMQKAMMARAPQPTPHSPTQPTRVSRGRSIDGIARYPRQGNFAPST